jgi:hypothetical protein
MTDMNIVAKIKKLLALGQANSGATDEEAATAMNMAGALMLKHNIEVQLDDDTPPEAKQGDMIVGWGEPWHIEVANAAAYLYSCRVIVWKRLGDVAFVGRPDNIDAARATAEFLRAEVERLYKLNLPRGMTKTDRANYRSTFKFSCGRRLAARAWAIMETLRQDDVKALEATGSRALVVVQSIDQMLAEADALLSDVKKLPARTYKFGLGSEAGRAAANTVQIQKQVGK